jgi:hypothetical protein
LWRKAPLTIPTAGGIEETADHMADDHKDVWPGILLTMFFLLLLAGGWLLLRYGTH